MAIPEPLLLLPATEIKSSENSKANGFKVLWLEGFVGECVEIGSYEVELPVEEETDDYCYINWKYVCCSGLGDWWLASGE
jgi:hypothetical protein